MQFSDAHLSFNKA